MRIATVAHRKGKGDLVWYSWVGAKKKKTVPAHGSTLVGVSKDGAFKLLEAIKTQKKTMHYDVWLRECCVHQTNNLQASYVLPSIGNFDEHISGCDPTNTGVPGGLRPSQWDDYWCMEGVRVDKKDSKHKTRNVCAFQEKGTDWGIPVQFGDDLKRMWWKTAEPPDCYWDKAPEMWTELLHQRGWLDDWGWLKIPTYLTRPRHNLSWRELEMEPDAHPWDAQSGTYSPISRLAEHLVIWHPDDFFIVKGHDTRTARDMRDHLTRYKRRCFSKPWEAGYSKI